MKQSNPYKVPEGYFAKLEQSILQKTVLSDNQCVCEDDKFERETLADDEKLLFDIQPKLDIEPKREEKGGMRSLMGFAAGFAVMVILAYGGFNLILGDSVKDGVEIKQSPLLAAEQSSDIPVAELPEEGEDLMSDNSMLASITNDMLMNMSEYRLIDILMDETQENNSDIMADDMIDYLSVTSEIHLDDLIDY